MNSLEALVKLAKNGDKDSFRQIFERFNNAVFAFAALRTSNRDDALDIVQETFIDLWDGLPKFKYRTDEEFGGFIFTVAKRKLYKYYKSRDKTVPLDEKMTDGAYEMESSDYQYLFQHVNSLSPDYQDVLKLRYWSEMSFGEIASILNIKETTAKVRHYRAIQQLKTLMEKYGNTI